MKGDEFMRLTKIKRSEAQLANQLVCWDWKEKKPNCR